MVVLILGIIPAVVCFIAMRTFDNNPFFFVGFISFLALAFIGIASLPPEDSMPQTKTTTTTVVDN